MHENITVNGAPLQEHLSQKLIQEVQEVRAGDLRKPLPKGGASKFNGNISHAKSGPVQVVYSPDQKAQNVVIDGTVFPWAEKGAFGFVASGESILGALECSADGSEVKCHECGGWKIHLGGHIGIHDMTMREYKIKHGFKQSSPIMAPSLREQRKQSFVSCLTPEIRKRALSSSLASRSKRMETYHSKSDELANLQMVCMAQLTIRLTNLAAKLGHCPSVIEMMAGDEHGPITYAAIKWAFNMTAREALRSIGLNVGLPGSAKGANSIADSKRLKILQMRSRGSSYREICAALDVSIPTAMKYVSLAS